MNTLTNHSIWLAGWPLRELSLDELVELLRFYRPRLIEISKDFIRDGISLKELARSLEQHRESDCALAYAGTTNLVTCAGLSWDRYRSYLAVQVAQARFLQCSLFRFMIGKRSPEVSAAEIMGRVQAFCSEIEPMNACVEIHGGVESEPEALKELLRATPVKIVIDLENMHRAGLSTDDLLSVIPLERIAYFHQRNLPPVWIEHQATLKDESRWRTMLATADFLWEPKTLDEPGRAQELFRAYHETNSGVVS